MSHYDSAAALQPVERPAWFDDGVVCHGKLKLFFGPHGERYDQRVVRETKALALCAACPVRSECQRWAREHRMLGSWGGENDEQRARAGFVPAGGDQNVVRRAKEAGR